MEEKLPQFATIQISKSMANIACLVKSSHGIATMDNLSALDGQVNARLLSSEAQQLSTFVT